MMPTCCKRSGATSERDLRKKYGSQYRIASADSGESALRLLQELKKRDYSEGAYTAAHFLFAGLAATGGRMENREAFVAAVRRVALPDAPRGAVRLDAWGNPVEDVYIRRVAVVLGQPRNTVIFTYPRVSQFWTFNPQEYLKQPVYSRDDPPAHP